MFRHEDFQSSNHKNKSSQKKINKKEKTSKRKSIKIIFIGFIYKVVGALGLYILFLLMH